MAKWLVSLIGEDFGGNVFTVEVSCDSISRENAKNTAISLLNPDMFSDIEVNWICECSHDGEVSF